MTRPTAPFYTPTVEGLRIIDGTRHGLHGWAELAEYVNCKPAEIHAAQKRLKELVEALRDAPEAAS